MTKHRDKVVDHFPEHEERIKSLWESNQSFVDLVKKYGGVADELDSVPAVDHDSPKAQELKVRHGALQDEILGMLRQTP